MAGIIAIYGLVVSVLISNDLNQQTALYTGFIQLGAGLSVGLAGLSAGFAIGIVGDAGVRGTAQQPRLFVGMILILIFAEVLGPSFILYLTRTCTDLHRSLWSYRCTSYELKKHTRTGLLITALDTNTRVRIPSRLEKTQETDISRTCGTFRPVCHHNALRAAIRI